MKEMTLRQLAVVNFIREFRARESKPPTIAEIAHGFGMTESSAFTHVDALRKKGVLTRSPRARCLRLQDLASFVGDDGAILALPWWEMLDAPASGRPQAFASAVAPERMLAVRIPASCAAGLPAGAGMRAGDVAFLAALPDGVDSLEHGEIKKDTWNDRSGETEPCAAVGGPGSAVLAACPFLRCAACVRGDSAGDAADRLKNRLQNNALRYDESGAGHVRIATASRGMQETIPICGMTPEPRSRIPDVDANHGANPLRGNALSEKAPRGSEPRSRIPDVDANHGANPLRGNALRESLSRSADFRPLPASCDVVLWRNVRTGRLRALPSDRFPASRQSARGRSWIPLGRIVAFQRIFRA